jgi:hypothetical protein
MEMTERKHGSETERGGRTFDPLSPSIGRNSGSPLPGKRQTRIVLSREPVTTSGYGGRNSPFGWRTGSTIWRQR